MSTSAVSPECSTITTAKVPGIRLSSDTVFSITLDDTAALVELPPGEIFAERTIALQNSSLWVAGQRIVTPTIVVRLEGERLYFGSSYVDVSQVVVQGPSPFTESDFARVYGTVPRAQELASSGLSWHAAAKIHSAEIQALATSARNDLAVAGPAAALQVFLQSPLIEEAQALDGSRISYRPVGLRVSSVVNLTAEALMSLSEVESMTARATRIANLVDCSLQGSQDGRLVLISRYGNMRTLSGELRIAAENQLSHLASGGSPSAMPDGPLTPASFVVTDGALVHR